VIVPSGLIRPIAGVVPWSVNQTFPSGPRVRFAGALVELRPALNSLIVPPGVIRPIALVVPESLNQTFPSRPVTIPLFDLDTAAPPPGKLPGFRPALNSLIVPPGVICPIAGTPASVNQTLPSGPDATPRGKLPGVRPLVNSITDPSGAAPAKQAPKRPAATRTSASDTSPRDEKGKPRRCVERELRV
jgi:hypothetical protein